MKEKFRAVLFDLDGTLLDTLEDLADSMNTVLNRLGYPAHSVDAYRYFVGDGIRKLALRALPPEARDAGTIEKTVADMRVEYGKRWKDKTMPYHHIPELIAGLYEKKRGIAILSNKPHEFTRITVEHFFPNRVFDAVLGAREDVPCKPDPFGAIEIAEMLSLRPENFVYLGDTATDMETATKAGMYAVGVLWGFRSAGELRESGARRLIADPLEMLCLFDD